MNVPLLLMLVSVLCLAHFGKGECTLMEAPGTPMLINISNVEDYNTFCPSRFYNDELHVDNAVELNVDMNVIRALRADYESDFEPHLGYSTTDICLKVPYDIDADVWFYRSDIKWYAPRTLAMYQKYLKHVKALGILDHFKGNWINADEVKVYQMQFVVRSHIEEISFHLDWPEPVCTQLVTFLIPINDMNIHLVYKDNGKRIQQYQYKVGKGIGFAGGFNHGTNAGHSDTPDVLFSVELGGIDPEIWDSWQRFGGHAYEYYMHPVKGFIKNERTRDICEPTKEESEKGDDDEKGSEESKTDLDNYGWKKLSKEQRAAAKVLGHNKKTWDESLKVKTDDLDWDELRLEQQEAAKVLKFNKEKWDKDD